MRGASKLRGPATSACAATWPPNTRCSMVSGCVARYRSGSMVSRSSSFASSSADPGTRSVSPVLLPVVTPVQARKEALELLADLLPRRQLTARFRERQRPSVLGGGPVEGVVLLLEAGHHVLDLRGVRDLGGDLGGLDLGRGLERTEVPL